MVSMHVLERRPTTVDVDKTELGQGHQKENNLLTELGIRRWVVLTVHNSEEEAVAVTMQR